MSDLGWLVLDQLVQTTLRGALLAAAVGLLLRAARVVDVRLTHLAWTAVVAATLAMPVLRAAVPALDVLPGAGASPVGAAIARLLGGGTSGIAADRDASSASGGAGAEKAMGSANTLTGGNGSGSAANGIAGSGAGAATGTDTAPLATAAVSRLEAAVMMAMRAMRAGEAPAWVRLLLAVYLLGALAMLASLLAGRVAAARLLRHSRALTSSDRAALWHGVPTHARHAQRARGDVRRRGTLRGGDLVGTERLQVDGLCAGRAGGGATRDGGLDDAGVSAWALAVPALEIRESPRVTAPFTFGLWRPVLLLPDEWRAWDTQARAAVLLHEQAHVARRDWAVQLLSLINRAVFWFNPLAWWLHRRLATLAELACDDAALAAAEDRHAYARTLLDFLSRGHHGRVVPLGVSMSTGTQWEARIDRILDEQRLLSRPARPIRVWLTVLIGAPLVWFAAGARPQAASPSSLAASVSVVSPSSHPSSFSAASFSAPASSRRVRGEESALAARWRETFEARTGDGARAERWIAYVVPSPVAGVTSSAGTGARWSFRDVRGGADAFDRSTYASVYADAWRRQAIRAPSSGAPTPVAANAPPGGGRRVAFLFHLPQGAVSPREIDGVKLRGLSEPLDVDPALITWLGESTAAESIPFLAEVYAALSSADLQKEIPCAVTVHDDTARVLAAIEPYLDFSKPAAVRSEAVQWLGRTRRDAAVRAIVERTARFDPDPYVRGEARDLLDD